MTKQIPLSFAGDDDSGADGLTWEKLFGHFPEWEIYRPLGAPGQVLIEAALDPAAGRNAPVT
jgi:hypothetical protein